MQAILTGGYVGFFLSNSYNAVVDNSFIHISGLRSLALLVDSICIVFCLQYSAAWRISILPICLSQIIRVCKFFSSFIKLSIVCFALFLTKTL
jgi:hypothetical protein